MNSLYLVTLDTETLIREHKPQSLQALWRHAVTQADRLFGIGNWFVKHDQSLPGGYIVCKASGNCILIK